MDEDTLGYAKAQRKLLKVYVLHTAMPPLHSVGPAVAQLVEALRYKVTGSIPDGVSGFFHWHNPGVDSASGG
jgi:hypothetical protein